MAATSPYPRAVYAMANHVSICLKTHRARSSTSPNRPPLFVGVQGPQGSGKTFLTSHLCALLADPPYALKAVVLSIDDLYLPHAGLTALAELYPRNRLLHGRGQPGTHDVALGRAILGALKGINDTTSSKTGVREVLLPMFDKSLFDGAGDRAPETRIVRAPVDVVVLEGWCVGFYPLPRAVVEARWATVERGGVPELDAIAFDMCAYTTLEDVLEVNVMLKAYVAWWNVLDTFIQIRGPLAESLAIVYRWRLQQEQDMKARNGGRGMADAQVKMYIPGYVFFVEGVRKGMVNEQGEETPPPWRGQGLVLELNLERQLVDTSQF